MLGSVWGGGGGVEWGVIPRRDRVCGHHSNVWVILNSVVLELGNTFASLLFIISLFTEYKKARQEIKRASSDTMRLQKKVKKGEKGERVVDGVGESSEKGEFSV